MTENEFEKFIKLCKKQLDKKQEEFMSKYELTEFIFSNAEIDLEKERIYFKKNNTVFLELEILCIGVWNGSWRKEKQTWVWGWAIESLSYEFREKSKLLIGLHKKTALPLFETALFPCTKEMANELLAFGVYESKAIGYFEKKVKNTLFYIAILPEKEKDGFNFF